MSASTASITANQRPITRRRAAEQSISAMGSDFAAAAVVTESEKREDRLTAGNTGAVVLRDATRAQTQIPTRKVAPSRKQARARWLSVIRILTRILALMVVSLGFVQMSRWVVMNSGGDVKDIAAISGDFEGKLSEMEKFVKTTMKAMQIQFHVVDQKLEDGISTVRKDLDKKIEQKGDELDLVLKALGARNDVFEKFMDEYGSKSLLSKEEFGDFFEKFKSARGSAGDFNEVSLDDVKNYAREIVEKEIQRHASDGLGMMDFASASGGAKVVRHSEPYGAVGLGTSSSWFMNRNRVSAEAEKMIKPSFGEPGHCFPLKGQNGFVEIRLRTAIIPEAVTLEHVHKSVAYDRSSAPKHCRVSGWMQGEYSSHMEVHSSKMILLAEFVYDLEKSNAQTFNVTAATSNPVDTIRFDVTSNQGSASYTCIYRLRVHGRELVHDPNSALEIRA
ncbi:Protein SAD1/UNC-84 domain protein 1 [Striga hermonthica]|uniref:Protein SAD1/UNC-84 domain protein 1 n=1 Tax=Striga hermonthica TaxID=68872 RepID=A0A9N7N171_STRHE|nr:Protein SAD1/UNC-84 domain protein 1 [Striga hermonthica]